MEVTVNVNQKDANTIENVATALNAGMTLEDFKVPSCTAEQKCLDQDFDLDSIRVEMKQSDANTSVAAESVAVERADVAASGIEIQQPSTHHETQQALNERDIAEFNGDDAVDVDYNSVAKQIINNEQFTYMDVRAAFTRKVHRTFDLGIWEQFTDTKLRLKIGKKICALAKAFSTYPDDQRVAEYCSVPVSAIEQDNPNKYYLAAFNYLMAKNCPDIDLNHKNIQKKAYGKKAE